MKLITGCIVCLSLSVLSYVNAAEPVSKQKESIAHNWSRKHLLQKGTKQADKHAGRSGLEVLANNDGISHNGVNGRPLKIGDKEYTRGLYVHANSKVVVYLPSPGKRFTATVGVSSYNS